MRNQRADIMAATFLLFQLLNRTRIGSTRASRGLLRDGVTV
jgi:hypothetical protein